MSVESLPGWRALGNLPEASCGQHRAHNKQPGAMPRTRRPAVSGRTGWTGSSQG